MLKNLNYIMISVFFILAFVMFLVFNPDSYPENVLHDVDFIISEKNMSETQKPDAKVAVISDGSIDSGIAENICFTLNSLHQEYAAFSSISDIGNADTAIVAVSDIKPEGISALKAFLSRGGKVIFADLPDSLPDEFMELLGIISYEPGYQAVGFDIYKGIFLGGMFRAEENPISCAKVNISGRCKVFADAYDEDISSVTDEYEPNPIIWRTYYENGVIFVINAPFMSEFSGAGILTGIMALASEDFIYPIVGTKTILLDNFPYTADENTIINGRSASIFTRDIVWPDLISIAKSIDVTFTCFTNDNFLKDKESLEMIQFLTDELYKLTRGELAYTLENSPDTAGLGINMEHLRNNFPRYEVRSVKLQEGPTAQDLSIFNDITAFITQSWDGGFAWVNENAVKLPVISSGINEYDTDFAFTSTLSAFGIALHSIDMSPIFTGEVMWNEYSLDTSKYLSKLFSDKDYLQAASVKNAAETVKSYLNMEMTVSRTDNKISVTTEYNDREIPFILRSAKSIDAGGCEGCTVSEIEDGVYLIKADGSSFSVVFK